MVKSCKRCCSEFETNMSYKFFCSRYCCKTYSLPLKKIYDRAYAATKKEIKKEYDRKRYLENAKEIGKRTSEYRKSLGPKRWQSEKEQLRTNPQKALYKRIQTLLKTYMRKGKVYHKYSKTFQMLDFTLLELYTKLRNTIPNGYTWDDFMTGELHIDHKKPHSLFSYKSHMDEQFKQCWSLDNLQLLPRLENIKKQNKYEIPS